LICQHFECELLEFEVACAASRVNSVRARAAHERARSIENDVDSTFTRRTGICGSRILAM
jgi:hypothetical protein